MKKKGKIAYISSKPYILKDTFRANIIFGLEYDADKYKKAITICELEVVINLLTNGDLTEIGDNGIMLSTGHR